MLGRKPPRDSGRSLAEFVGVPGGAFSENGLSLGVAGAGRSRCVGVFAFGVWRLANWIVSHWIMMLWPFGGVFRWELLYKSFVGDETRFDFAFSSMPSLCWHLDGGTREMSREALSGEVDGFLIMQRVVNSTSWPGASADLSMLEYEDTVDA